MLRNPRFKSHFHVAITEGDGIFLLSERHRVVLKGKLYELLSRWLTGRHSTDEILALAQVDASAAEIYYALMQLEKKGYIREDEIVRANGEAAFWDCLGVAPAAAASSVAATAVCVRAFGVDPEPFVRLLRSAGVRVEEHGDLQVVLTDDYLRNDLRACNRDALAHQRSWLLMQPVGCEVLIGPLFRPGVTACWECLAQRLSAHREVDMYAAARAPRGEPLRIHRAFTDYTQGVAWNLGVGRVVELLATGRATLDGRILSFDLVTCAARTHSVIRRPQCVACGCPEVYLTQQRRPAWIDNGADMSERIGDDSDALGATFERFAQHVSPITGIISTLERCGSANDGAPIHVYAATHVFGKHHATLHGLTRSLNVSSAGKGTTDLAAQVGAICEALERYSGDFSGEELRSPASATELGDAAIHPNACMLFSDRQFAERETLNANTCIEVVPVPFDDTARIEWSPVWSLTGRRFRYLPTAFCYYNYPQPPHSTYCEGCSNGNAAGRTIADAIVQGFLELVERDSVAVWWYNRLCMPSVQIDSFDDPYVNRIYRWLAEHGSELWVLDLTTDLNVPVFAALSRRVGPGPEHIVMGFGAHFEPRAALLRAVLELNQVSQIAPRLLEQAKAAAGRDVLTPELTKWLQTATVRNHPYLLPDESIPAKTMAEYPRDRDRRIGEQIDVCTTIVEQHGMEMLVLDQTRPDVQLPVVKVVVPGLRHFWPRFAPGRLYDVPVRLGRMREPLREDQLNPIPMFL